MKCLQIKTLIICFLSATLSQVPNGILAQSVIQIGAGTNTGVYPLYSPLYRFSAASATTHCRSNILFTQEELATAGITAGSTITSIAFEKLSERYFLIAPVFKILMANTSNTTLLTTTTWTSILQTHTSVYANNNFNLPPIPGWVTWNITPFIYSGGALEIATDLVMAGANATTGFWGWRYTDNIPTDRIIGATGTNAAPEILNGVNANYKLRPDIKITFTPPITTPLNLLGFTAVAKENNVVLNWETTNEKDFSHFEIECSENGPIYKNISKVNSLGIASTNTNSYTYTDLKKQAGRYYYRLKMVDKDGSYVYSKSVAADVEAENIMLLTSVTYNPANQRLTVILNMSKPSSIIYEVIDVNGRRALPPRTMLLVRGQQVVSVENIHSLQKGIYWLTITSAKQTITREFIK